MNHLQIILLVTFFFCTLCIRSSICRTPTTCRESTTCDQCIQMIGCAWCKDLKDPYTQFERCKKLEDHINGKCSQIEKAEGAKPKITRNEPISTTMRIQPQGVELKLAVGQEEKIKLSYNDKTDKPLDLYYIMDLSATMNDDKATVSAQADALVKELKRITGDVRLGFGSFIDKPVLPFVSSSQLREDEDYAIPYGFKNSLSLTEHTGQFREIVSNAKISRNLDEPEGTLDALMQAIKCQKEIGWRNESRKLIVVATDGPFHIAGDGKLGGIVRPNDMKCHMKDNMYTHSKLIDYPSIGEINAVILQHKVYVIFAVSTLQGDEVFKVYEELQKHITQSTAEQLNADSSNVVQKIKKKYEEISKTVKLAVEEAPSHVDVQIKAKCSSNSGYSNQAFCNNVGVGSQIDFEIAIKLKQCPDPRNQLNLKERSKIVLSFFELSAREKLEIDLTYACKCNCNSERNEDENNLVRYCHGAAKHISCGMCNCKDDRNGKTCECSITNENDQGNRTNCNDPSSKDKVECSNRGECKCGQCICPKDYNGKFCEDSTIPCQNKNGQYSGRICSDNGQCVKGKCVCSEGFDGPFCECEKSRKVSCVEPGKPITDICNGRGTCNCDGSQAQCKCKSEYGGRYCQTCKIKCPSNQEKQQSRCGDKVLKKCVLCKVLKSEGGKLASCIDECKWPKPSDTDAGKRRDVGSLEIMELKSLSDVDGTECEIQVNASCTTKFRYSYQPASASNQGELDTLLLYYVPKLIICAREAPILWLIFGVILSVLLAGIFGLIIWKLATHIHDTREFQRFEKERSLAKWQAGENPLFIEPKREFQNPAYRE